MRLQQDGAATEAAFTVSPLVTLLVRLLDERWSGTVLVHDDGDEALARLRLDGGMIVAGRMPGMRGALFDRVSALCARQDTHTVEVEGTDLVGGGPDVVAAAIDPLLLIASAVRSSLRQTIVDEAIASIGGDLLKLSPRAELGRYGFDRHELHTLAALEPAPLDLSELSAHSDLSVPHLRRLLCTLLATRALTRVPAWKRIASGEIAHAPQVPPNPARREDEPTVIVALEAVAREQARRAASLPSRRANSTHLEYLPKPMSRSPLARQPGTSERPAVPYIVHHPRLGIEVARSIPPRAPGARTTDPPTRDAADERFRVAEQLLQKGNTRGAVFEAQSAMKLASPRPAQRALYAWLLFQRSGEKQTVPPNVFAHLDEALEQDPDCAVAHHFKGSLLARLGRMQDAVMHLERALQLDPGLDAAAAELRRCRPSR